MQAFCDLHVEYGSCLHAPDSTEKNPTSLTVEDSSQVLQEKNMAGI